MPKEIVSNGESCFVEYESVADYIKDNEEIVFSYSVQYSNIPKMVKDFIDKNQHLWQGKKVFVIATMGLFSGDGAGILARQLHKYGAQITGGLHLKMPDSIADVKALKRPQKKIRSLLNYMNKRNYQKELDARLAKHEANRESPTLLMHSCCAPCSSYCLSYLAEYMKITIYYYNPNITAPEEYRKRVEEQKRLIASLPVRYPVMFAEGEYQPEEFFEIARGYEQCKEGGERCFRCYELRLRRAVSYAAEHGFDYVTTTLSVSPHKNAEKLNEIGERVAAEIGGVTYLCSDFKKKGGYQKSIALSREYGLYRQDYCGCVYSQAEREKEKGQKTGRQGEWARSR